MTVDDAERWRQQEAVKRLVDVARQWAPTRLARTGSGRVQVLVDAVAALEGVDVEDLFSATRDEGYETGRTDEMRVHFG